MNTVPTIGPPPLPFSDLSDAELRALVRGAHRQRAYAAIELARRAWLHLRWLFAPAGRPWRGVFNRRWPSALNTPTSLEPHGR